jgi:hypothetical protein
LAGDFVVHPIRWDWCKSAAGDPHARAWITLQSYTGRPLNCAASQLPWIPNEDDWHSILHVAHLEPIRNRVMLAFAYDAGLRRGGVLRSP